MLMTGVGRIGRDAEVRFIQSGTAVCNLALAFNYGQKQQDGSKLSQWVDFALWGKQADALAPYLKKGGQVSVTASDVHIETYTKQDGTEQSKLVGNIINIEFCGRAQQAPAQQAESKPLDNFDDAPFDDDIPF